MISKNPLLRPNSGKIFWVLLHKYFLPLPLLPSRTLQKEFFWKAVDKVTLRLKKIFKICAHILFCYSQSSCLSRSAGGHTLICGKYTRVQCIHKRPPPSSSLTSHPSDWGRENNMRQHFVKGSLSKIFSGKKYLWCKPSFLMYCMQGFTGLEWPQGQNQH